MKSSRQDGGILTTVRITGYAFGLALLVFAVWLVGLLLHEAFHSSRIIRVRFPEVGTLMAEDPVAMNGVPVGDVRSITLQNGYPLAEIEMYRQGSLASDARFIDFNQSLMGARMVLLIPGHSQTPMDESQVQEGIFADGVAESLRRVNDLLHMIAEVRLQMDRLFLDPSSPLSSENFRRLENGTQKLGDLSQRITLLGKSLQEGIASWVHLEGSLQTGFHGVNSGLPRTEDQTDVLLQKALSAEESADTVLTSAEKLLASVQDSSGGIHALLYDPAAYNDLKNSLNVLDEALHTYQNGGLSHVVGWGNLHFFRAKSP